MKLNKPTLVGMSVQKDSFVLFAGIVSGDAMMNVPPGVTVKFTCTGPTDPFQPTWFVNGKIAKSDEHCYKWKLSEADGQNYTSTLKINGNHTCDTFDVYCRIYSGPQKLYLHNTTLTVQGK